MQFKRFTIEITPQHIADGIERGPQSCVLAMAMRDAGHKYPLVDEYAREVSFLTEDGREWAAALNQPAVSWEPGPVNLAAVEINSLTEA